MEPRAEQDGDLPPDAAPSDAAQPEPREADLLSLALIVFFVALIGVVGALLLVPALF